MHPSPRSLMPTQASAALGVSAKTLRLYERQGLITPGRTRSGWRTYDARAMERAGRIIALRGLGLSLAQVADILDRGPHDLDSGLAAHEDRLREQSRRTAAALERLRVLRTDLDQGRAPVLEPLTRVVAQGVPLSAGFSLPWPWNGEWFAIDDVPPLAFITGPLGSGKTRFAQRLAAALPDAMFLGLDRVSDPAFSRRIEDDAEFAARVERRLMWLQREGADRSDALLALIGALEAARPAVLVIDMVEQGLSAATQTALMTHLRRRGTNKRAVILMTRSSAILDLDAIKPTEIIILCPANHSVPLRVMPRPGVRGYEAVSTCVAAPEVRARTAGIVAMRPGHDHSTAQP